MPLQLLPDALKLSSLAESGTYKYFIHYKYVIGNYLIYFSDIFSFLSCFGMESVLVAMSLSVLVWSSCSDEDFPSSSLSVLKPLALSTSCVSDGE